MKSKKILITIVAVVAVVAATFGITYAAWDKPSDASSLNATVGGNVNINAKITDAGDVDSTLVPVGTEFAAKDTACLTLGTVVVDNNPVNGVSKDTDRLDVTWNVTAVKVTYAPPVDGTTTVTGEQTLDVELFKEIFKITIEYGNDSTISNYGEIVPMDTNLKVLMVFIEDTDTILDDTARKYREAKFEITVEFTAATKVVA